MSGFVPGPGLPKQLAEAGISPTLSAYTPQALPENAVILMPYALNHLLERRGGVIDEPIALGMANWVQGALGRGGTVVIADMPPDQHDIWPPLLNALGVSCSATVLHFSDHSRDLADLYGNLEDQSLRSGAKYPKMARASVLAVSRNGQWFLEEPRATASK